MPTLDWLNREDAFRISARVPTRVLRPHAHASGVVGDAASARDNLLVQGDNLEALAALLPFYRGRVKCIFIDPPYNTKSAFEHYDDNLEHSAWLTLAYRVGAQGELALLEREAVFEQVELNLLAEPVALPGLSMVEQGATWNVYLDGARVRVAAAAGDQMGLAGVRGTATVDDLARWLAANLQHPARNVAQDVTPAHLRAFIVATLRHLIDAQRLPLEQLVRHQHTLARQLEARIAELRDRAAHAAFRQCVLDQGWHVEASAEHRFEFGPAYPVAANRRYDGKFSFTKHYYPVLASLKDKGEEWHCAVAIDRHPQVARWVRNLDSDPVAGFWLPTSFGRFYPDFVCELKDGRLLVVEYKGAHLATVAKEIEKGEVGKLWAERSGGRCLFAMVFKERGGLGVGQQIDAALAGAA